MKSIKRYIAALAALTVVSLAIIVPATSAASRQGNIVQTAAAAGQFKTSSSSPKWPAWPARSRARAR